MARGGDGMEGRKVRKCSVLISVDWQACAAGVRTWNRRGGRGLDLIGGTGGFVDV